LQLLIDVQMKGIDTATIASRINRTLKELPIHWIWKADVSLGIGFCDTAVWSRAARRHKPDISGEAMVGNFVPENMKFGFKICLLYPIGEIASVKVVVRWLKGHDSVVFESFCGMIRRKIQT
jgi:23S rRNA (adenine1618-N6)-methyltransferase